MKTNLYIVTICDHHNVVVNVGIFIEQAVGGIDTFILRNESFEVSNTVFICIYIHVYIIYNPLPRRHLG